MENQRPEENSLPQGKLEKLHVELHDAQKELRDRVTAISQFLNFVMALTSENLTDIHSQMEKIRDIAREINRQTKA